MIKLSFEFVVFDRLHRHRRRADCRSTRVRTAEHGVSPVEPETPARGRSTAPGASRVDPPPSVPLTGRPRLAAESPPAVVLKAISA